MEKISEIAPSTTFKNEIESKSRRLVDKINEIMEAKNIVLGVSSSYETADYYSPHFTVCCNNEVVFSATYHSLFDKPSIEKFDYIPCGSKYYCFEKSKFISGNWVYDLKNSTNEAFEKIEEEDKNIYNEEIDKKIKMIRTSK